MIMLTGLGNFSFNRPTRKFAVLLEFVLYKGSSKLLSWKSLADQVSQCLLLLDYAVP